MESRPQYIQVILPLRLGWEPWYRAQCPVERGSRVEVTFSQRRYIGVVSRICERPGIDEAQVQDVLSYPSLDPISEEELRLWQFTSEYYLCTIGEVFKAAYPFRKTQSESSAAQRKDKQAATMARMADVLRKRIARLEAQKADTEHRRNELSSARDSLAALLAPKSPEPPSKAPKDTAAASKPLLIIADQRYREEKYLESIRATLSGGRSSLVLVPEIGLAGNMESRLREEFPDKLRVHHSLKSQTERRKVAEDLRDITAPEVILGTRSSLFLPFRDLGLVVIDEEQDSNYKQTDPSPRYNARDLAVVLAGIHKADVLLGSPCPSLESLYNAWNGKYGIDAAQAPSIRAGIIDISDERRKRGMDGRLSYRLISELKRADGPVAIVRGWEPADELEAEILKLLPGKEVDILSISQAQISSGHYAVAAFVQADALFPKADFRSDEKAIQAITRISLIADRVIVQTAKSGHPVYQALLSGSGLHEALMQERKMFGLPPYSRLIAVEDSNTLRLGAAMRRMGLGTKISKPGPSQIVVSIAKDAAFASEKERIAKAIAKAEAEFGRSGHPSIDVDPQ